MDIIQIDSLEIMRKLLPLVDIYVDEECREMHYRFKQEASARHYEDVANRLIIANALPLVAEVALWSAYGVVFEANLIITYAPEMEDHPCY